MNKPTGQPGRATEYLPQTKVNPSCNSIFSSHFHYISAEEDHGDGGHYGANKQQHACFGKHLQQAGIAPQHIKK